VVVVGIITVSDNEHRHHRTDARFLQRKNWDPGESCVLDLRQSVYFFQPGSVYFILDGSHCNIHLWCHVHLLYPVIATRCTR